MKNILVVEDSPEFQILIQDALSVKFNVTLCSTAAQAIQLIEKQSFDAILLDVRLPDEDGFHLCAHIRGNATHRLVPILFLTSKKETSDKLLGFSAGADDYVVKPFDKIELLARLESRIQRIKSITETDEVLSCANLRINISMHRATIAIADQEKVLDLTPFEIRLLTQLIRAEGKILTRDQLLNIVWGQNTEVNDRTVDRHISSLRKKLNGAEVKIQSIYSEGYIFSKS